MELSVNQYALIDRELVEARDRALDKIIADGLFFVPGGDEGFGEEFRTETDFVEPVRSGEVASGGEALARFLEIAGLLPRLRELETRPRKFVGESRAG